MSSERPSNDPARTSCMARQDPHHCTRPLHSQCTLWISPRRTAREHSRHTQFPDQSPRRALRRGSRCTTRLPSDCMCPLRMPRTQSMGPRHRQFAQLHKSCTRSADLRSTCLDGRLDTGSTAPSHDHTGRTRKFCMPLTRVESTSQADTLMSWCGTEWLGLSRHRSSRQGSARTP